METTQMPNDRWMGKEDVIHIYIYTHIHIYNEILAIKGTKLGHL